MIDDFIVMISYDDFFFPTAINQFVLNFFYIKTIYNSDSRFIISHFYRLDDNLCSSLIPFVYIYIYFEILFYYVYRYVKGFYLLEKTDFPEEKRRKLQRNFLCLIARKRRKIKLNETSC